MEGKTSTFLGICIDGWRLGRLGGKWWDTPAKDDVAINTQLFRLYWFSNTTLTTTHSLPCILELRTS